MTWQMLLLQSSTTNRHTHTHTQLGGMLEGEEQYIAFSFHVKTAFGVHFNKTPLTKKSGLE